MIRTTIAAVAATAALGLIAAPVSQADICANHDATHYVTACANGPGSNGPIVQWTDVHHKTHFNRVGDIPANRMPSSAATP